jgi:hypothetical protein
MRSCRLGVSVVGSPPGDAASASAGENATLAIIQRRFKCARRNETIKAAKSAQNDLLTQ